MNCDPKSVDTLLTTNNAPTPHERVAVYRECDSMRSELAAYETEIQLLREKASLLQQKLCSHKSILSPFRTLPSDILYEIFLQFVGPSILVGEIDILDRRAPPYTLSQVCRRWRALSLRSPRLWCYISVSVDANNIHRSENALVACLSRSCMAPLSVRVCIDGGSRWRDSVDTTALFTSLAPHIPHIHYLSLQCEPYHLRSLSAFLDIRAPILKSLELCHSVDENPSYTTSSDWVEGREFLSHSSPALQSVDILTETITQSAEPIPTAVLLPILPWGQLVILSLNSISKNFCMGRNELYHILSQCNVLETLCLALSKFQDTGIVNTSHFDETSLPILLPKLKSLTLLSHIDTSQVGNFISFSHLCRDLKVPALRELKVDGSFDSDFLEEDILLGIERMVAQSRCAITCLKLRGMLLPIEPFKVLMGHLSDYLVQLHLREPGQSETFTMIDESHLEVLTAHKGAKNLVPHLKHLTLAYDEWVVSRRVLMEMLFSRSEYMRGRGNRGVQRLERVNLVQRKMFNDRMDFGEMWQSGIQIEIEESQPPGP